MADLHTPLRTELDVTLTKDDAEYIAAFIGDEDGAGDEVVRLLIGDGHAGYGLYATHPDYPEEGAILVKKLPDPAALAKAVAPSARADDAHTEQQEQSK